MTTIAVRKLNEIYVQVSCDDQGVIQELRDFFTFAVPNAHFIPAVKNKQWDGKIRMMSPFGLVYGGLVPYIEEFAAHREYSLKLDKELILDEKLTPEQLLGDIPLLNMQPREYQLEAVIHALTKQKALLISPTASGKSLIVYLIAEYLDLPTLIIVPTTSLVKQMRGDLIAYGMNPLDISIIMSGEEKNVNTRVVISTWQSAVNMPKKWFDRYQIVCGDEAHLFKAKSLEKIMNNLPNCKYRIGLTGTLDGTKVHKLVLEGLFGKVYTVATSKKLSEDGHISAVSVKVLLLKYTDDERRAVSKMPYVDEMRFLLKHPRRNKFITNLTMSLKGNTLVLFNIIEHGKFLFDMLEEATIGTGRNVYLIYGAVEADDREEIRHIVENESNAIIIGSYGTVSTGVNIRNLHNAIAASPTKSVIRVLQSMGRISRLGDDKTTATWYDIGDDLSWKSKSNHTLKHFGERVKIFSEQQLNTKFFTRNV